MESLDQRVADRREQSRPVRLVRWGNSPRFLRNKQPGQSESQRNNANREPLNNNYPHKTKFLRIGLGMREAARFPREKWGVSRGQSLNRYRKTPIREGCYHICAMLWIGRGI
jgi:hypothetical protein